MPQNLKLAFKEIAKADRDRLMFIVEMDKMKSIYRQTLIMDKSRTETDAEHSWHLAMLALALEPHVPQDADFLKILKMCLVHDIVEIDAGDTFAFDELGYETKAMREQKAAKRIFAILPEEEGKLMRSIWEEFEAGETIEAKFANSLDRLQPLLVHVFTEGVSWKAHDVRFDQVVARVAVIEHAMPEIWPFVSSILEIARKEHLLKE